MDSISTNEYAIALRNNLNVSSKDLSETLERMSSGFKINCAKDDVAGSVILDKTSVQLSGMNVAQKNLQDGVSLLNVAEGSLSQASELLSRLRDLCLKSSNSTYSTDEKSAMQQEADELVKELNRIQKGTTFKDINLFKNPKEEKLTSKDDTKTNKMDKDDALKLINENLTTLSSVDTTAVNDSVGAYDFNKNETKIITIKGHDYEITNRNTVSATLSYSVDETTGDITFTSNKFTIKAKDDSSQSYIINGQYNYIYGGNGDDKFTQYNSLSRYNDFYGQGGDDTFDIIAYGGTVYGGDGDDTINYISCRSYNTCYAGAGNDTINSYSGSNTIYCQDGDDTVNLYSNNSTVYGASGNNTININSNNNKVYGGDGDDIINILKGDSNLVNGGGGNNQLIDNGTNTSSINVPGANSGLVAFKKGETQVLTIDGKQYTVTNRQSYANDFLYKINDGQITFLSSNFTIKSQLDVSHNVALNGVNTYFYGGDKDDIIINNGVVGANYIFGMGGDDDITINGNNWSNTVWGGDGNDTIRVKTICATIYGGDGDDNVIYYSSNSSSITSFNFVDLGKGNNTISSVTSNGTVNSKLNIVNAAIFGEGNNNSFSFSPSASNSVIDGFGSNEYTKIELDAKETKTIEINGISYTIKNNNTTAGFTRSLYYKYDSVQDKIIFAGDTISITGQKDAIHNVELYGKHLLFYGGDEDDTIATIKSGVEKGMII